MSFQIPFPGPVCMHRSTGTCTSNNIVILCGSLVAAGAYVEAKGQMGLNPEEIPKSHIGWLPDCLLSAPPMLGVHICFLKGITKVKISFQ